MFLKLSCKNYNTYNTFHTSIVRIVSIVQSYNTCHTSIVSIVGIVRGGQSKNCYEKKPKNVYSDEISKYSTNEIEKVKFKGTEASK